MIKVLLSSFVYLTLSSTAIFAAVTAPTKSDYPHWNFDNKETYLKLERINNFIENNKGKHVLAVFDWDGTLYNEHIPVKEMDNNEYAGQPAFYIWGANNPNDFKFKIFPMYWTKDGDFKANVIQEDKYLEGHTNINADGYSKFIQTSMFTAGMTQKELEIAVNKFLDQYKPEKYAFLPMLDVLQKMENEGFDVWIITGSNQHFVGTMLRYIQKNLDYKPGEKYNFSKILSPTEKSEMHIAGNGLKLMENNRFSVVYDSRYTQNPENKLYIVDKEGKES